MKKLSLSLLLAFPLFASAQTLQVRNNIIDLGQVQFMQPITATFDVKNISNAPIEISSMYSGCNCTQVGFPVGVIPAGTDFKVSATYDSKQLGHFQRDVAIYVKDQKEPTYVTVKGVVVPKVENFVGNYPYSIGGLLTDANIIEFDDVNRGERPVQDIHIMNPNNQFVEPVLMHLPDYLRAEISPKRLGPKKEGVIHIMLNSSKMKSLGLSQASIYLSKGMGDKVSEDKEIMVSTVLLPPEPRLDEASLYRSPRIQISSTTVDLSNIKGSKKKAEIVITNKGKSPLEIRSMQLFTPGIEITLAKQKLNAGESTKMKITGYAQDLSRVKTRPRILMITNDPRQQKVIIEIKK
jgi:hypothetical protein